jgi:hypothetical protein
MVPTYSINPSSTNFAESKTTISDVLSLLPDNTSKEITPRDVRDAVFSTWESSVIRYTNDGTTDYIGIDRDDVKDKKVFLGKKQISGLNVMSSSLLSSDTDVFLYNTKSDSAVSQNFKMSLLAGTSSILWTSSPYFSSVYVSGANPHLSLGIVNPSTYGTINIQSGSSASISINNLNWPSTSEVNSMTISPSASTNTDLFLAVRSGGNIELLTYQSSNSTLGTPGVTTSIVGSPVLVNGSPLEYTNTTPTIATFGGIVPGSTFSNVSLYDLLSQMLYPYLGPVSNINITTPLQFNSSLEREHVSGYTINYSYTLTKRTNNITQNTLRVVNGNGVAVLNTSGATLSGTGLLTQTFNTSVAISNTNISGVVGNNIFTFSSTPNDGTQSYTASTTIEFVWPYFYGFNSTYVVTGVNSILNNLVKRVDIKTNQVLSLNGNGYLYFCYPSLYGTVSSILDGNDYVEYTHGSSGVWTYSTDTLSSQDGFGWTGRQYYIYRKNLETTIPTTQNYKFNF